MNDDELLQLLTDPPTLGEHAVARRNELLGPQARVRSAPPLPPDSRHAVVRGDVATAVLAWPPAREIEPGDRWVLDVEATPAGRERWLAWLRLAAERADAEFTVAPFAGTPGGLHRLWCIAVARLVLPGTVRIEARHDLIDTRLAQIALGFGADTLSGPLEGDRRLPLAGVTRPDETTRAGLATLAQWAGLQTQDPDHPPA